MEHGFDVAHPGDAPAANPIPTSGPLIEWSGRTLGPLCQKLKSTGARLVARLPPFELTKKNSLSRLSVVVVVRVLDDDHLVVMMIIPIAIHIAMVLMDDDLIFGLRGRGIGCDER
jgi:hypothetical protein